MRRSVVTLLLALAPATLAPRPARAAADSISPEAREHFKAGVNYLQDPEGQRFEEAYAEFKAAYALSQSPKVLGNIGLCAMKLERDGEAIDAYTKYLNEVSAIDPDERAQIVRDLETLKASTAHIVVRLAGATAMLQDTRIPVRGQNITNIYGPVTGSIELSIRPGHHELKVTGVDGQDRGAWEFNIGAGATLSHEFSAVAAPPPADRRASPSLVAPWIVAGIGGGALAAGGIMGALTMSKVRSLEQKCPNNACPPNSGFQSDVSQARTFVTVTDGLLIGGGVVAAAGVTWLLIAGSRSRDAAPAHTSGDSLGGPRVGAVCGPTGCLATFGAGFE